MTTAEFTCAVCGDAVVDEDCDTIAAQAEESLAQEFLGGPLGPTCSDCRAEFLAWIEEEGADS